MKKVYLVLLVLVLATACTKKVTFEPFHSKQGRFTVNTPVELAEKTSEMESEFGKLVEHDFYGVHDEVAYVVGYIDLPDEVYEALRKNPSLLNNLSGLASASKGRIMAERGVHAEGRNNHGKEVLISLPDGKNNMVSRVIWSGETLYLIHAIIPKQPSYNQDIHSSRFLNSLRIDEDA